MKKQISLILAIILITAFQALGQVMPNWIPRFSTSSGTLINSAIYQKNSNIGIGTVNAESKLHVHNSLTTLEENAALKVSTYYRTVRDFSTGIYYAAFSGKAYINFETKCDGGGAPPAPESESANVKASIGLYRSYGSGSSSRMFFGFVDPITNELDEKMHISYSGNVGIGTMSTYNHKLAVAGSIIAEAIVVKLRSTWPDYVFNQNYNLKPLSEVKSFIDENNHLPGIPSADEVAKEGIDLGEMNALLLQKIEELTLYTIQQQELIEELRKELDEFRETFNK